VLVANQSELLSFVESRVGTRAVAEDLLQDAFVRAAHSVETHSEESILAWFYRALRNAAVD
jgi:RNA polymerase sigma-70 factor (ECF subfamily)